jgi:hypothetical protein
VLFAADLDCGVDAGLHYWSVSTMLVFVVFVSENDLLPELLWLGGC